MAGWLLTSLLVGNIFWYGRYRLWGPASGVALNVPYLIVVWPNVGAIVGAVVMATFHGINWYRWYHKGHGWRLW